MAMYENGTSVQPSSDEQSRADGVRCGRDGAELARATGQRVRSRCANIADTTGDERSDLRAEFADVAGVDKYSFNNFAFYLSILSSHFVHKLFNFPFEYVLN